MRSEIMIEGADAAGANYITWAPVHSSISLVETNGRTDPVDVLLRNQNPSSKGGQIVFHDVIPGEVQDTLRLRLPADGTPVVFFVAGKFGRPSEKDKDAVIEVVEANTENALSTKALMVRIRKNANDLTEDERDRFLEAFAELNGKGKGRFSDFRDMHRSAATFEGHFAAGFLPWHRAYLLDLERELQQIDPSVALPYWRFDKPAPNLFKPEFIGVPNEIGTVEFAPSNPLRYWETDNQNVVTRIPEFNTTTSPATPNPPDNPLSDEAATMSLGKRYADFWAMEMNPHGSAHISFEPGSFLEQIDTAARDPLFFLLHCNVDRLWAKWQVLNQRFNAADAATYPRQGSPGVTRIGHRLEDKMWPWDRGPQGTKPPRPLTAPGGTLADSPTTNAPGEEPMVSDMIDYQGVIDSGNRLGFGYDDVDLDDVVP